MAGRSSPRARLERVRRRQLHVRVRRSPRFADTVDGFIVAVGRRWALMALTGDGGYFEGWAAIRVKQVKRVRKLQSFEADFARTQPEWPPRPPGDVDLESTQGMLRSLARLGDVVGVEQENRIRDCLWIGRVDDVADGWLWLREVDLQARWQDEPRAYRLRHLTQVTIADRYLTALAQVAGDPSHPG